MDYVGWYQSVCLLCHCPSLTHYLIHIIPPASLAPIWKDQCEGQSSRDLPGKFEHQEPSCTISSRGAAGNELIDYLSQDRKSKGNSLCMTLAVGRRSTQEGGQSAQLKRESVCDQGKEGRRVAAQILNTCKSLNFVYAQLAWPAALFWEREIERGGFSDPFWSIVLPFMWFGPMYCPACNKFTWLRWFQLGLTRHGGVCTGCTHNMRHM